MVFDFDRIAEEYDSTRTFDPKLLESVAEAIYGILWPGASVLDIGSGTGRFLLPLTRKGLSACGVDISKSMLKKSREKGLKCLIRADASRMPFPDAQFDAAFFSSVLHLIDSWKEAVIEACRVSRSAVISLDPGRHRDDNLHEIFKSIMKEKEFKIPQKGPYETDLCEACTPERRIPLPPFTETKRKPEVLAAFKSRTYTYQSELSEEQNRICLEELEKRIPDEEINIRWQPALIVWNPARLAKDVVKTTFRYPH